MKYEPAPLTPFLPALPGDSPLFLRHGSPLPTDHSTRNPSAFCSPLFSRTYELPPPHHRFASHAFSSTYKSLFSQPLSFHIYTKPPGVAHHPLPTLLSHA